MIYKTSKYKTGDFVIVQPPKRQLDTFPGMKKYSNKICCINWVYKVQTMNRTDYYYTVNYNEEKCYFFWAEEWLLPYENYSDVNEVDIISFLKGD